jgi:hypothetical protein
MEYHEPIVFTILLIFDAHDLISRYRIDIEILKNFSRAVTEGYKSMSKFYQKKNKIFFLS